MFIALKTLDIHNRTGSIATKLKSSYPKDYHEHTYFMILSVSQRIMLELLLADPEIKVVAQPPLAVNKVPGHGETPRNQLIVFEINDVTKQATV
jgi:hypothetical protein